MQLVPRNRQWCFTHISNTSGKRLVYRNTSSRAWGYLLPRSFRLFISRTDLLLLLVTTKYIRLGSQLHSKGHRACASNQLKAANLIRIREFFSVKFSRCRTAGGRQYSMNLWPDGGHPHTQFRNHRLCQHILSARLPIARLTKPIVSKNRVPVMKCVEFSSFFFLYCHYFWHICIYSI